MSDDEKRFPEDGSILFGYVQGPMRLEKSGGGDDQYVDPAPGKTGRWLWKYGPKTFNAVQPDGSMVKRTYGVTHLQKKSWFGFLIFSPFCFHFWKQRRFQEQDAKGNWIPGTEHTWYGRTGGSRDDAGEGKFVPSKGFISNKHWD